MPKTISGELTGRDFPIEFWRGLALGLLQRLKERERGSTQVAWKTIGPIISGISPRRPPDKRGASDIPMPMSNAEAAELASGVPFVSERMRREMEGHRALLAHIESELKSTLP